MSRSVINENSSTGGAVGLTLNERFSQLPPPRKAHVIVKQAKRADVKSEYGFATNA